MATGTLPSNTVQNPKSDVHCMAITTRGGKQTIDPPMPSNEEKVRKDAEVPVKVIPMPRPPPPFP